MSLSKKQQTLFAALVAAINASAEGFVFATEADVAAFVNEKLIEINPSMQNDAGQIAVRLVKMNAGAAAEPVKPVVKSAFTIEDDIAIPTGSGRGRGANTYPFDALNVGQSFFVPNGPDKPNAAKSLASTVSSATARYAEIVPGEFKKNRKGQEVPVTKATRNFVIRSVEGGARIWRTA